MVPSWGLTTDYGWEESSQIGVRYLRFSLTLATSLAPRSVSEVTAKL